MISHTVCILLCFIPAILIVSLSLPLFGNFNVYGVEFFSEDESPFDISYDEWISQFWNWWISIPTGQDIPPPNGCLINRSDSMVMLMETADIQSANNVCQISSTDGILIPLWAGWADTATPHDPNKELSEITREEANLGVIRSNVVLDGVPVAKLDISLSLNGGEVDYNIRSLDNVTEIYTSDFDLTIPPDTHKPKQVPGDWVAGSHGWWVFMKPPLPSGEHTLQYDVRVEQPGAAAMPWFSQITYHLNVE